MSTVFIDETSCAWFKSSYSAAHGECVEVANLRDALAMRDTKHRELGALFFAADEWQAFLGPARNELL